MPPDIAKLDDDQLLAENERLMAARADAEHGFKVKQTAIQHELTRRDATQRLSVALEGLTPEQRTSVLADLQAATSRED